MLLHEIPVGLAPGPQGPQQLPLNPYASNEAAAQEGRMLFSRYNCDGCHGGHAGGGMGPSLRDETWVYGSEPAHIFDSIAQGRSYGMPAWSGKIPVEEMWKLVTFIKTLRTPNEPDAPNEHIPPPPEQE